MAKKQLTTKKTNGRIYTPDYIVNNILDLSEYYGNNILQKHVIDNSCGDGAFLTNIVDRYCQVAISSDYNLEQLSNELNIYIHGIEIDQTECDKCIANLNITIKKYDLPDISWDIKCANALFIKDYDGKMDFVLGNPPYIRVHNLTTEFDTVKDYSFSQNGMTDLYIVFYELGLKMLNSHGILGYITPSSFFNSLAGKTLRQYLVEHRNLKKIVDLKHYQAFQATTYTTIVIINNSRIFNSIDYYEFDTTNQIPYFVDTLSYNDFYISDNFYFARKKCLEELKTILNFSCRNSTIEVKNGFATLADSFFIGDFDFNDHVIPILKASTGVWTKCLFPYVDNKLIPLEILSQNTKIKSYYESNATRLKQRSLENGSDWHGFGRSQGINDVYKYKYAINTLIKNVKDIKLNICDIGCGIYSGLYIITDLSYNDLKDILFSDDFINYISTLGKYKSGGYYTFSSNDLKHYLNYKLSQRRAYSDEQSNVFANA